MGHPASTLRQTPALLTLPDALTGAAIVAYVAALMFGPVIDGHDTWLSFSHIQTWANALRAGDLVSVWTPLDANGFGSPMPFFYHKLFNVLAAALTLATGDVVTGARLALLTFSAAMFCGVAQCAARLGADARSRSIVAIASLVSPYAVVCITQRGAYAEYSAMTLVPLGIALTLDFFQRRARVRHALGLFAVLLLIATAHVVTFVFADGLAFACAAWLVFRAPRQGLPLLAAAFAATVAFVALIYVPFVVWSVYFCPGQALLHGLVTDNAVAFHRIFSPTPASWFGWPVITLVVGLALQWRHRGNWRATTVLVTGATACLLLVLTTRLATPLWRLSPMLDFVQFPWRLLAVITPLAFVAFAGMIEQLPPTLKRRVQLALLAVSFLSAAGMLRWVTSEFTLIPVAELRQQEPWTGPGPDAGGEYFPARYQARLAAQPHLLKVGANIVLPARRPLVESSGGCEAGAVAPASYFRELRFGVRCTPDNNPDNAPGLVRINQFDTPFLDVTATGPNGAIVHRQPAAEGPDAAFYTLPLANGQWVVKVRQRTYLELVRMAWGRELRKWTAQGEKRSTS